MQVVVDSLLTSYSRSEVSDAADASSKSRSRQAKNSPEVIILHGWGDNAAGLQALQADLADGYNVTVLDLPGFGSTDQPSKAWGLSEYADFVAAFLKKVKVKPYAIVGHSNGGAIAVRGLAQGSLKAERLVLLASAGIRTELQGRRQVLRLLTKAGKIITYPLPKSVKKRLRHHLYTTVGSDLLVAEHMQATFKRIVTDDIQKDAASLALPTLLIYGEDDMAAPMHYGRILHNLIAGSTLETVGQAGHFVHLDKPQEVTAMIRNFLR